MKRLVVIFREEITVQGEKSKGSGTVNRAVAGLWQGTEDGQKSVMGNERRIPGGKKAQKSSGPAEQLGAKLPIWLQRTMTWDPKSKRPPGSYGQKRGPKWEQKW